MKTEAEIRQQLEHLEWILSLPCTCTTPTQKQQCWVDRLLLKATMGTLTWVIGDHPTHDRVVAKIARLHATGESLRCQASRTPPGKER